MPIPHDPLSIPGWPLPISTSVTPDCGNNLLMFKLGIRTDEEQSNVPLVLKRMIVGIPAFAILFLGWYPPFARISMICFPSTTLTLLADTVSLDEEPA